MGFVITEMSVFVAVDDGDGDEGVIGMTTDMGWMPLVGADMARIESLKPIAKQIAKALRKKVVLKKFKLAGEEEV